MSTEDDPLDAHEEWLFNRCPNDAGDEHRWGWINSKDAAGNLLGRNIFYVHRCGGRLVLGTIDVASGTKHQLISEEPIHVEPSILCGSCQDHGFLRDGRWVPA